MSCVNNCKSSQNFWALIKQNECHCAQVITGGFILEKDGSCKSNVKEIEVIPMSNLTCINLKSLPEKNLYLRDYYVPSFTSSQAIYECAAGYAFGSGVSRYPFVVQFF